MSDQVFATTTAAIIAAGMLACRLVRAADGTAATGRHAEATDVPAVARASGLPAA
ncbi:hypothetical protein [Dankookia rubra]|uniref:hypothetical protein n=1 Tax=Dankookia rubra TaxID=1442381 RepID=UPI001409A70E|nr:hypothetical protein [Dankookia rubra]